MTMVTIPMNVSVTDDSVQMSAATARVSTPVEIGSAIEITSSDVYTGETTVTPTDSVQVLPTKEKYLTEDITVEPIPSNYGLITWNGSFITVS